MSTRKAPPSTGDWRNRFGERIYEIIKSGNSLPKLADLAQWLNDEVDFQPDLAEVSRELNRRLRRLTD